MRFLLDQDVYELTARLLIQSGCDVLRVRDLGLSRADDVTLLRAARERGCVLVTRDRDYGYLVFVEAVQWGVIYLRIAPATVEAVHTELERLLREQPFDRLKRAFTVVEPGRYRIRSLCHDA
ncbi:MAG: DUF5615 family PIN-like protein [Acidobacteria bacterium]|nr:DUF5615 family PIN-like protein [Acidobacteriota bacterium]